MMLPSQMTWVVRHAKKGTGAARMNKRGGENRVPRGNFPLGSGNPGSHHFLWLKYLMLPSPVQKIDHSIMGGKPEGHGQA